MDHSSSTPPAQTVVGLFDDQIAAEQALSALRKISRPAASISVLARDRRISDGRPDTAVDVTRAVVDTAMTTVSGWLTGLAALMVPNQGHFLAAGPIGVVLAKLRPGADSTSASASEEPRAAEPVGSVGLALQRFGFRPEEAHYLEQRLAAGSTMIAVTADVKGQIAAALRAFGDNDAVYIGQAETPGSIIAEAEQGLINPMSARSTEVIVADIVAPFRRVCHGDNDIGDLTRLCGADVFDEQGDHLGEVDEILVDEEDDSKVRYVIVGHGGMLGIARRRYPVPAELAHLHEIPLRVTLGRRKLGDSEAYDPNEPFSRKHEQALTSYFKIKPYWEG